MPRLLQGVVRVLGGEAAVTHEGAAAYDWSEQDPLRHLVFTKAATVFGPTFYRTQAQEIISYARALVAAERHEPGFGWKFAAYMRDPRRGKGNRIQGSVAPAILAAADPEGPHTASYVAKCLGHRADDVALFAAHFSNLGLGEVPEAARRGMARALAQMDDYQILKYSRRQLPLLRRRPGGQRATLRLVDAMGLARRYLDERTGRIYRYLRAPTSSRTRLAAGIPLVAARRAFFTGGDARDFAASRLAIEQVLSHMGSTREAWSRIQDVPGLLPDMAFKQYVRSMYLAGVPLEALLEQARSRRFAGLWPHQIYAGYRTVRCGTERTNHAGETRFSRDPCPQLAVVFEAMLARVADELLPDSPSLGIADVSGSMFGVPLGGERSSVMVGDAACVLAALMARRLGYAATFSDRIYLADRTQGQPALELAEALRSGPGMGSTQVAGAVVSLIHILLQEPARPRPRTLYFFSDMQFSPPELQQLGSGECRLLAEIDSLFDPHRPPLLSAIQAYRRKLGPVDVVLWNMAAYDNAPLPCRLDGVLMLAGFDAQTFSHVTTWQAGGSRAVAAAAGGEIAGASAPAVTDEARAQDAELQHIRSF